MLTIVLLLAIGAFVFLNQPSFGRAPSGERLERIKNSPNFSNGKFQNITPAVSLVSEEPKIVSLYKFVFSNIKDLIPQYDLPSQKTDLKKFERDEDILVWMGHSSLYMQLSGKRILVDPVLVMGSPVSFINKPFKGTNNYRPEDMPDIDYLIISHDHWDHLDYNTLLKLRNRIGKVICPLGVGEHLEYWGFDKDHIIELDWNETVTLDKGIVINSLPARHFSGRGFTTDNTLWASYMLQSSAGNIYISGDTGYDEHFLDIKKRFGHIDLAIIENGQYDKGWKDIHLMPDDLVAAAKVLKADRLFTVHNSKYALSKHAWYTPLDNISNASERDSLNLITPMIGEPVYLKSKNKTFSTWWKTTVN